MFIAIVATIVAKLRRSGMCLGCVRRGMRFAEGNAKLCRYCGAWVDTFPSPPRRHQIGSGGKEAP